jgi:hypothetical protein
VIAALNDPVHRLEVFTKDADLGLDFDRLVDLHSTNSCPGVFGLGGVIGMNQTWTQMTAPYVVTGRIRFITRDVAIMDGASTNRRGGDACTECATTVCDEGGRT